MNKEHILEDYHRMGKNFMTPIVKDYVLTSDGRVVELSTGNGIRGEKIWGVSEFKWNKGIETTRRGQMFTSIRDARRYFNILLGAN